MRAQPKKKPRSARKPVRVGPVFDRAERVQDVSRGVAVLLRTLRRLPAGDADKKPPKVEFDKDGKKIVTEYDKDGGVARISKYGKGGRLISRVDPILSGGFSYTEFDANGNPDEITVYGPDGRKISKKTYSTDANGDTTVAGRIYDYDENGKATGDHTVTDTFDKNTGKKTKHEEQDYTYDGQRSTRRIVEYGPKGKPTGGRLIEDFGKVGAEEYQTTTEFDADGKIISVTDKHVSKNKLVEETVTEYEDGKPTKRTTTEHNPDGSFKRQKTTEWDDDGKVKKRTTLEFLARGGEIETEAKYRRDKRSGTISTTIAESRYAADGKCVGQVSYRMT